MTHPLEKLAEMFELRATLMIGHHADGPVQPYAAGCVRHCAIELRAALAALWHPFDPEDDGTWPAVPASAHGMFQVFDGEIVCVGHFIAHSFKWRVHYGPYTDITDGITHYAELLPGPKR